MVKTRRIKLASLESPSYHGPMDQVKRMHHLKDCLHYGMERFQDHEPNEEEKEKSRSLSFF